MLSPALGLWMSQLAPGRPVWLLSNLALTQITWLDVTVTQASSASPITARPCQLWMQRQTFRYSSLLGWDQYEAIQNVVTVWKQLHIYIRQSKLSKTKATNTKNRIKADVLTLQPHTWFRTIQAWDFTGLWWLSKLFPKKNKQKKTWRKTAELIKLLKFAAAVNQERRSKGSGEKRGAQSNSLSDHKLQAAPGGKQRHFEPFQKTKCTSIIADVADSGIND